jgi:hypothetical protein
MGDRCTEKVDMFSYGVILWELITGEAPARGRLRSVKCVRLPVRALQHGHVLQSAIWTVSHDSVGCHIFRLPVSSHAHPQQVMLSKSCWGWAA